MGNICCDDRLKDQRHLAEQKIKIIDQPKVPIQRSIILKPDDFQSRKYLGKGSFGSVVLVKRKHVKSDKLYAMKIIDKQQIKEKNLLQTDLIEKVLCCSHNPFLVEIIYTFQNQSKIYIVMEYIEGGDMYFYLAHQRLTESIIRKLVPEIVQALQFLHNNNIIYRDLKPQNVLVTPDGHIKITDFGLSCHYLESQPLFTYAGIIEYMAPEVIEKRGYDKMVDLWSLGILLYQLKHGYTPFRQMDGETTKRNILTKAYQFDPSCSTDFISLISQLLVRDPRQRLTIPQLKKHPFFKDEVNWNSVRDRTNEPPMKDILKRVNIKYKGAEDTAERTVELVMTHQRSFRPELHEFSNVQQSLI